MPDETGSDLYLTDVSPGDKPWDVHRTTAEKVEGLYERATSYREAQLNYSRYAERIHTCSRLLNFAMEPQEDGTLRLKLHRCQFCRVRHCPVCQWRRSLMWRARFFQALPKVAEAYPTARWIFLTLTVPNCPLEALREVLADMNRAWVRLTKRKQFPALGSVKSVEVTRAKNDLAHPHFHCLLMVPASYFGKNYLSQAEWTELWKHALRADYSPIVNVKAIKSQKRSQESEGQQLPAGLISGILESLKYAVKPDDLVGKGGSEESFAQNAEWLARLTEQLYKTRAISVGGVLRHYIGEEEPEDLIHAEGEEVTLTDDELQVWFGWREMIQRYAKVEKQ